MPFRSCFVLIGLIILLSSGCHTTSPRYATSIQQAQSEIQSSIQANRRVAMRSSPLPKSVSNALLPSTVPDESANDSMAKRRFNISANQLSARAFFMGLVEGTSYNVVINPNVKGSITLDLKNVTLDEALEAVHDVYGYEFEKTSYGFQVLPPDLQTQVFNVNYLDVKRNGKSRMQINSGQLSEVVGTVNVGGTTGTNNTTSTTGEQTVSNSSVDTSSEFNFWSSLESTLKAMVAQDKDHSVVVNRQAGVVAIRAYPAELQQVARYLDQLQNNLTRQVILEAKILEVQLDDQFQAGINWNLFGKVFNSITDASGNLTTAIDGGGVAQDATRTFDNTRLNDFDGMLALNVKGDFGLLIKLLQTQGNVQVLSSPRISTVNNQKAIIKVGQDEFFVTGVSTSQFLSNGVSSTPTQDISLTPFFSGITLDVTPQISNDGSVILHVHPSVSTVRDQQKNILLNTPITLPLALSTIRESDNIVRARNGQVIVIGGLIQNNTSEETAGFPVLSKIPFIGAAFRRTQQLSTKSELVILLKTTVIQGSSTWNNDLQNTNRNFEKLNRGFHLGGLPEVFGTEGEREPQRFSKTETTQSFNGYKGEKG